MTDIVGSPLTLPATKIELLTNAAFGDYGGRPHGSSRRVAPKLLLCLHITAGTGTAQQNRDYANRAGSGGPSAHDYIDQDGRVVHAIDTTHTAWSNGAANGYDTANAAAGPIIAAIRAGVAAGYNPNELYVREIECVGDGAHPITAAQKRVVAAILAADSLAHGIPITRATVGLHRDLNTTNRPNCPFATNREGQLAGIIAAARAIAALGA